MTYADFSPLQLISGGSLTLNMMSGVTLANNTNYNELIQLTSGTPRHREREPQLRGQDRRPRRGCESKPGGGSKNAHRCCHPGPQRGHGEHHRRQISLTAATRMVMPRSMPRRAAASALPAAKSASRAARE
ncbi:MAG: hypothetical protein ACLTSG_09945 [Lachnospiraceae bacterium]